MPCPSSSSASCWDLDEEAAHLADQVKRAGDSIRTNQLRLRKPACDTIPQKEYQDLIVAVREAVAEQPRLSARASAAEATARRCRQWLESLPEGTQLRLRAVDVDGHDLGSVRARIKECEGELERLRRAPTPSPDLEERLKAYVASLGEPEISGFQAGETLHVFWPNSGGPISLAAVLAPDVVTAALLRKVERMANTPLPMAQRKQRMAVLEHEVTELCYLAAALAAAGDQRAWDGLPPWAILGAEIVAAGAEQKSERERATA
jgi:hypothetical protein